MANRRHLGENQPGHPRALAGSLEEESPAQRRNRGQPICQNNRGGREDRGYDGGKKIRGRKRHLLVDTEGFVLKAKVHSAKVMDYEGIKPLLERVEQFSRLSHLWLDSAYRGNGKGKGWVEKTLGWTVELVERPRKPAAEEVLKLWAKEWSREDVTVDWEKLLPPRGFIALPRCWVVERTFA